MTTGMLLITLDNCLRHSKDGARRFTEISNNGHALWQV